MILYVLSLRDVKSDTFGSPIFTPNVGGTIRDITDYVNDRDPKETAQKHPSDFHLMRLGTFDNVKGRFDLLPLPDFILDLGSLRVAQGGGEAAAAPVASVSGPAPIAGVPADY